jgi:hypothetical protein
MARAHAIALRAVEYFVFMPVLKTIVIPGRALAGTSDVQLHIGESRDSGFDASHRPGMTTT